MEVEVVELDDVVEVRVTELEDSVLELEVLVLEVVEETLHVVVVDVVELLLTLDVVELVRLVAVRVVKEIVEVERLLEVELVVFVADVVVDVLSVKLYRVLLCVQEVVDLLIEVDDVVEKLVEEVRLTWPVPQGRRHHSMTSLTIPTQPENH